MSGDSTLAQFNRIYYAGKKNHFALLGASEQEKFDYIYKQKGLLDNPEAGEKADPNLSLEQQ